MKHRSPKTTRTLPRRRQEEDTSFGSKTSDTGHNMAPTESTQMLLHDTLKQFSVERSTKKKSQITINHLILLTIILTNTFSIITSSLTTYILTTELQGDRAVADPGVGAVADHGERHKLGLLLKDHDKRSGLRDIEENERDGRIGALGLHHQHGDSSAVESSDRPGTRLHQGLSHTQSAVVHIEVSGEAKNNTAQDELSDMWLEDK